MDNLDYFEETIWKEVVLQIPVSNFLTEAGVVAVDVLVVEIFCGFVVVDVIEGCPWFVTLDVDVLVKIEYLFLKDGDVN